LIKSTLTRSQRFSKAQKRGKLTIKTLQEYLEMIKKPEGLRRTTGK
jgi:hypothetical protein